ncbi:MAG: hypothetical protein ABEI52_03350, partial [Halobacteriaceae archaeon]
DVDIKTYNKRHQDLELPTMPEFGLESDTDGQILKLCINKVIKRSLDRIDISDVTLGELLWVHMLLSKGVIHPFVIPNNDEIKQYFNSFRPRIIKDLSPHDIDMRTWINQYVPGPLPDLKSYKSQRNMNYYNLDEMSRDIKKRVKREFIYQNQDPESYLGDEQKRLILTRYILNAFHESDKLLPFVVFAEYIHDEVMNLSVLKHNDIGENTIDLLMDTYFHIQKYETHTYTRNRIVKNDGLLFHLYKVYNLITHKNALSNHLDSQIYENEELLKSTEALIRQILRRRFSKLKMSPQLLRFMYFEGIHIMGSLQSTIRIMTKTAGFNDAYSEKLANSFSRSYNFDAGLFKYEDKQDEIFRQLQLNQDETDVAVISCVKGHPTATEETPTSSSLEVMSTLTLSSFLSDTSYYSDSMNEVRQFVDDAIDESGLKINSGRGKYTFKLDSSKLVGKSASEVSPSDQ